MNFGTVVGCLMCGKYRNVAKGEYRCRECVAEYAKPHPLRQWRDLMSKKLGELTEETRLTRMTLVRAEHGDRMSRDVADTIERHTGVPAQVFRQKKVKR